MRVAAKLKADSPIELRLEFSLITAIQYEVHIPRDQSLENGYFLFF